MKGATINIILGDFHKMFNSGIGTIHNRFINHSSKIWIKDLIPFEEPLDSPWLAALQKAYREATAEEPELHFMIGWTDASYYSALAGIPTFLIGPSADGEAHSPTEKVEIAALMRSAKTLAAFLIATLGKD